MVSQYAETCLNCMQEALCSVIQSRDLLASRSDRPEQTRLRCDLMSLVQCGSACACSLAGIMAEHISNGTLHSQLLVQGWLASARQFSSLGPHCTSIRGLPGCKESLLCERKHGMSPCSCEIARCSLSISEWY